ncbi:MAG: hydrogenase maturation protease [Actinomycetota bacterium]|nr:hydrogenase maturation protease [Actinomycetota bacterium]
MRGDDGFGPAVAAALDGELPEAAELIETGIGGIGIVHQLMDGYGALVIVDAVERGAAPGTVFVLVPEVPDIATPTFDEWLAQLADMHLAEPSRILRIARAAGVLPERVLVVGCQPESCDDFDEVLSPHVAAAVPVAAQRVCDLVAELSAVANPASQPQAKPPRTLTGGSVCGRC